MSTKSLVCANTVLRTTLYGCVSLITVALSFSRWLWTARSCCCARSFSSLSALHTSLFTSSATADAPKSSMIPTARHRLGPMAIATRTGSSTRPWRLTRKVPAPLRSLSSKQSVPSWAMGMKEGNHAYTFEGRRFEAFVVEPVATDESKRPAVLLGHTAIGMQEEFMCVRSPCLSAMLRKEKGRR